MRRLFISILLSLVQMALYADNLIWFDGTRPVTYFLETPKADPVVRWLLICFLPICWL